MSKYSFMPIGFQEDMIKEIEIMGCLEQIQKKVEELVVENPDEKIYVHYVNQIKNSISEKREEFNRKYGIGAEI